MKEDFINNYASGNISILAYTLQTHNVINA